MLMLTYARPATSPRQLAASGSVLAKGFTSGTLRLPAASVEGRGVVQLDDNGNCILHREEIDLVDAAARGTLRNRKSAQNLAEFLDVARRPDNIDPDEWAGTVASLLVGVPGAGAFDIEPLEDERESSVALAIFALVSAAGLCASYLALGGGEAHLFETAGTVCESVAESPYWYNQCVSDLF